MKHKIYSLLLLVFLLCASSSLIVSAATSAETETTAAQTITVKKTVKVNKKFKIKKALKSYNINVKNYTFTSSNTKVATVSAKGVVKGLKKGNAVITVTSKTDASVFAQINVKVKNRYTKSQLRLMSAIIYSEAGNECYAGKKAVGIVIMNRVRSSLFPNTVKGVIYQSGQFSPVRNGSLNNSLKLYDNGSLDKGCIKAAKSVLNGDTTVSYKKKTIDMSSYLYFSGYIQNCKLQIQNHMFK